jgi:cell division protein YceG involved in septum cleavage
MKTILVTVMILMLSGCSLFFIPVFDSKEYDTLIEIAASSSRGTCTTEETAHLARLTNYLRYYTEYLPHNDRIHLGVMELQHTVDSLHAQTLRESLDLPITPTYCALRLRVIHRMATTLAFAAGSKAS